MLNSQWGQAFHLSLWPSRKKFLNRCEARRSIVIRCRRKYDLYDFHLGSYACRSTDELHVVLDQLSDQKDLSDEMANLFNHPTINEQYDEVSFDLFWSLIYLIIFL